jgi:6,7-dimethyl-8-ribityllumazine synthase
MKVINRKNIPSSAKVAVVVSHFNNDITDKLLEGALSTLKENLNENNITVVHVPGAVEIPLTLKRLAQTKQFDALVALSAVIYGETDHYQYVCDNINQGCSRVTLDENIPIGFGVLTVRSREHAIERSGGKKGNAGAEAAEVALHLISVLEQISEH